MRATGGESDKRISLPDMFSGDDFLFFHCAHAETRQVVFTGPVHSRHLCGFAACQGAAGQFTTPGNAFHNVCRGCHVQPGTGEIVQKEQGFRALHQDIVDAHGNQVYADGIVPVQFDGEFYFRSGAVGA